MGVLLNEYVRHKTGVLKSDQYLGKVIASLN